MSTQSKEQISNERGANYGDFCTQFAAAQQLKAMLVEAAMDDVTKEGMHMICTKLSRIAHGNPNHIDSWVDIAGYADLIVKHLTAKEKRAPKPPTVPPGSWVVDVPIGVKP